MSGGYERPHTLWYWKTPIAVTVAVAALVVAYPGSAMGLFPIWLLFFIGWMAWSIVSGLYPWSIRMGGL